MPDNIWIGDCPAKGPSECAPEYASLWDGLVGLWAPALGPTGNALFDLSGHNNHGTLINMDPATDWVGGPSGWALDFDGSDDDINCGVSPIHNVYQSHSIIARFANHKVGWRCIVSRNRDTTASNYYGLWVTAGSQIHYGGPGNSPLIGAVLIPAQWYTAAATYDGTTKRLYLDAELQGSRSVSWKSLTSANLWIGSAGSAGEQLDGSIEYVSLYSRALSAAEIATICADPFALLRPAQQSPAWWYSPGTPPASSIAAIHDYYRRLRCA